MKNLLLPICALLCSSALVAGSLSLSDKAGNPVPDGMVIHLWGDVNTSLLKFEFDARNIGSTTHISKMKKLEVFQVPATVNIFCWDVCYLEDSVMVSTGTVSLTPNQTWLYGATDYYPQGQLGTTIVKYTIFRTSNPNDSNYFEVHYHITAVGMENEWSNGLQIVSSPNPSSDGSFSIEIPEALSGNDLHIEIYSIDGKKISSEIQLPIERKLLLTLPEKGLYIVRIYLNGVLAGAVRQVIVN